jgi:hypothetical protein
LAFEGPPVERFKALANRFIIEKCHNRLHGVSKGARSRMIDSRARPGKASPEREFNNSAQNVAGHCLFFGSPTA